MLPSIPLVADFSSVQNQSLFPGFLHVIVDMGVALDAGGFEPLFSAEESPTVSVPFHVMDLSGRLQALSSHLTEGVHSEEEGPKDLVSLVVPLRFRVHPAHPFSTFHWCLQICRVTRAIA
jgi:hypothetical protein